jgi:hypothetical protein
MIRFAMVSLTWKLLLVVGRSLASAGDDEVSGVSDSLLSKLHRIVGGVEVSIVSFITDMRNMFGTHLRRGATPHRSASSSHGTSNHPINPQRRRKKADTPTWSLCWMMDLITFVVAL